MEKNEDPKVRTWLSEAAAWAILVIVVGVVWFGFWKVSSAWPAEPLHVRINRWNTTSMPCDALVAVKDVGSSIKAGDIVKIAPAGGFTGKLETDGKLFKIVHINSLIRPEADALEGPEIDDKGQIVRERRYILPVGDPDDKWFDAKSEVFADKKFQRMSTATKAVADQGADQAAAAKPGLPGTETQK